MITTLPLIGTILTCSTMSHAPMQEAPIAIDAPIESVTVFPDGARIDHALTVELQEGESRLHVELLPDIEPDQMQSLLDMRAIARGAHIRETRVKLHRVKADDEAIEALESEIETTAEALQTARIRAQNSTSDRELLDLFASRMAEGATGIDRDRLVELLEFLSERRRTLSEDILRQSAAQDEQARKLEELQQRLDTLLTGEPSGVAELVIDSTGGAVTINIVWNDRESAWNPSFRIDRETESGQALVTMDARVHNRSPLDWTGARIMLSNATPVPVSLLDQVAPIRVDVLSDDQGDVDSELLLDEALVGKFRDSTITQAGSVHFYALTTPATIEAGTSKVLKVADFTSPAGMQAIARPTVSSKVIAQAVLTNPQDLLLLPGPVALGIDGTYIGETRLQSAVQPGMSFEVAYGPMPEISVERSVIERTQENTGLLGGGRRTRTSYRIEILNAGTNPVELMLEDRMPLSENDDIEITLKNVSPPLSTDAGYLETLRPSGILRWDIALPAGGPDAEPVVIEWTVDVSHSADLDTTPIPR